MAGFFICLCHRHKVQAIVHLIDKLSKRKPSKPGLKFRYVTTERYDRGVDRGLVQLVYSFAIFGPCTHAGLVSIAVLVVAPRLLVNKTP